MWTYFKQDQFFLRGKIAKNTVLSLTAEISALVSSKTSLNVLFIVTAIFLPLLRWLEMSDAERKKGRKSRGQGEGNQLTQQTVRLGAQGKTSYDNSA